MFGELQESGGKGDEEEEKHPEGEAAEEKEEKATTTGLANSVRDLVSTTLTLSSRYGIQHTRTAIIGFILSVKCQEKVK